MIYTEMIKWYTDTVLSTNTVWAVAAKKAIETMDRYSLERILSTGIGLLPTEADYMATSLIRQELQRRKKEEKKMHKKQRVNGHVVHKLPKCENLYYTVEPENSRITVHVLKHDEGTGELYYYYYGYMQICTKQLGRHGYLQEQIDWLIRRYSDTIPIRSYLEREKLMREDLKVLNNTIFKEEKKMDKKKYYSGSVTVKTWRTRKTFNNLDDIMSNCKTDLITFREGRYMGAVLDPGNKKPARLPIDTLSTYTKEDIAKDITSAWDAGIYAEDQTDISWIFNSDPEGVTGKLRIGRGGEFGFGVTRDELSAGCGAIYYYLPENRDPTVLEFKNGKYVRGDNDGGLTSFAPFNLWRSIFGDNRFYETWADVKKAVVEAINNRKIYVNVPCIPDLIEEDCCIDD